MSERNPIRLFVTHAFAKHADWLRVFEYLENASNFFYVNLSDPEAAPAAGPDGVHEALRQQMADAETVLVLSGLYDDHRDLIQFQLDCAGALDKAIVAVEPFGGALEMPAAVRARADEVVRWNDRDIVDAIRRQARHEDTQRWEVIDFP